MTAGRSSQGVLGLKKIRRAGSIYGLVRMTIGMVFIWSGIAKLIAPKEFSVIIESYGLIPDIWSIPAASFLFASEVVAGLGLMLDLRGSLSVITGLLILFMTVLSYGIWMGLDIDCGCFGPQDPEFEAFHGLGAALIRDIFMLLGIFYLYYQRLYQNVTPNGLEVCLKLFKRRRMNDANRKNRF